MKSQFNLMARGKRIIPIIESYVIRHNSLFNYSHSTQSAGLHNLQFLLLTVFSSLIIIINIVPFSMRNCLDSYLSSLWQINFIVLVNSIAAIARNHEKIIKKPLGLKPTKSPKTIIDEFRNLSPADVEFLKQVDKQFKVHGDKIKIKVERENSTAVTNKNTKRTIDSSLG